ncbi:hypothetical protein Hypma_012974 [Hypsizygus marmoreus]|uniref:Uncharacterized protein n=1 Tax=Hypsizygus marmoreus TaxID=39966 RepID=A0A369JDD8_HYPMA|nr:hypothetical protein Hypma_012974 [Hypsizygus marmoreus]
MHLVSLHKALLGVNSSSNHLSSTLPPSPPLPPASPPPFRASCGRIWYTSMRQAIEMSRCPHAEADAAHSDTARIPAGLAGGVTRPGDGGCRDGAQGRRARDGQGHMARLAIQNPYSRLVV